MSRLSTHVLDTSRGRPAAGVTVILESAKNDGTFAELSRGVTDSDGRIADLHSAGPLARGDYRLRFLTGDYLRARGDAVFYPEVPVRFAIDDAAARYHLPLLLSPFGYSTYRGS
jgi:5-hydroxyisourate hydrolase